MNTRNNIANWISELTSKFDLLRIFLALVDIFVLSVILYICARFFVGIMKKRSGRLLAGIFAFILIVSFSYILNLHATFFLLENVLQFGVVAIVVIFQPELRSLLENVGYAGKNFKLRNLFFEPNEQVRAIEAVVSAVIDMSKQSVGALIVFQGEKELNAYDERKAVSLNCDITKEIIENIFFKNTPLHDGAVIIRDFRITQARVLFDEISNNPDLALNLGSRHKAGVGATEQDSKCLAIIVSEETGQISFACDGILTQNISPEKLSGLLNKKLVVKQAVEQKNDRRKAKLEK